MPHSTNPKFFTGQVSRSDPATGLIHVDPYASTDTGQTGMMQGVPLVNLFAVTLGFRENITYPIGAQVLCMDITGGACIILGILPDHDHGDVSYWSRACLQTEDSNSQDAKCNTIGYGKDVINMMMANNYKPTDVTEGEYVISNELGVLVGLFQELAVLKGSELAQIQCFLLDDLVRMISHNFSHWTAAGELNVWHDGKAIMVEQGMTHLSREGMGIPQTTNNPQPMFAESGEPTPDDSSDYYKFEKDERSKAVERLKLFAGRLGDFLHVYLCRPDATATRALNGEAGGLFDTGLMDVHLGTDGRVSVRTATGLSIEKTNWIRVPLRVRTPEDPNGDEVADIEFEDKKPFEWDNKYKVRENPVGYFLQLRDCLAYTQDKYAYLNFAKYKKDFKFSKETTDQENQLNSCEDIDPTTKFKFSDYKLRRSGLYFMDNGGLMLKDAWGSAIVMEGGDIYLQPAKDLVAQPLRHNVIKAGHSLQMAAKKHIDISSSDEGLRIKTQKVQHLYSKEQGIILQSDAASTSAPTPNDKAYDEFGGILLLSKTAGVYSYGKKIFNTSSEDSLYKAAQTLTLESEDGDVWLLPQNNLYLFPTGDILATTEGSLIFAGSGSALFAGAGSTAIGAVGQTIGMTSTPGSIPSSLDGVIPVDSIVAGIQAARSMIDEASQLTMYPFDTESKFNEVKFRFLASDKFNLTEEEDFIPMTIAQQDDASFGFLNLSTWTEKEVETTLPFPGKDKFEQYYLKTDTLKNVKKSNASEDYESKPYDSITSTGATLTLGSLNNYKVKE